jgi:hypothetical protein
MLEWTARFGYSALYAMLPLLGMPAGEFLLALAEGRTPLLLPSNEWGGSLRLSTPPYPHSEDAPETEGLPIIGLDLEDPTIWPLDVMKTGDRLSISGFDGIVCEVSGAEDGLADCWHTIYNKAEAIEIPEVQYRTDVFQDVVMRLEQLADLGLVDEDDLWGDGLPEVAGSDVSEQ